MAIGFLALAAVAAVAIAYLEFKPWARDAMLERLGVTELVTEQRDARARAAALGDAKDAAEAAVATIGRDTPVWKRLMGSLSVVAIPFVILFFVCFALARGVKVYEEFVEGAKEGFNVAVRIMPYLVAILVAMAIFRDSGAFLIVKKAVGPIFAAVGFPVDLLPLAVMRPLSGSGSSGMLAEVLANDGLSNTLKYTAATMFGSTETTFYVLAVYFGSVGVRKSRHALPAGLCADAAGIVAAVVVCRAFFG